VRHFADYVLLAGELSPKSQSHVIFVLARHQRRLPTCAGSPN
jgi:hypothetical protein